MEPVLIAAPTEKSHTALVRALTGCIGRKPPAVWASTGADARRRLSEKEWGLIIVNAPLGDEFGTELAQFAAEQSSAGVLLLVKSDIEEDVSDTVLADGVLVLSKPLAHHSFFQAVRLALAAHARIAALTRENSRLRTRLEEQRLISRAKCILIECCGMTEPEAHTYIEKRAMDTRQTKREIARELIETNS